MDPIESTSSALARVVIARREQLIFRVSLALAVAVVCQVLTGWMIALVWVAAYTAVQVGEHCAFRDVSTNTELTRRQMYTVLGTISAGTSVFGALGILQAIYSGPWGLACAALVWSGAIVNGAMVNSGSRPALFASIIPTGLYFLSAPFFALVAGASVAHGFIIIFASVLNIVAVVKIWSMSQTLIDTERRERLMTHLTLHDPESGLPNRRALEQDIARMLASQNDLIVVVAVLGIDRFAQVRGAIGYEPFAALINEVAGRLAGLHSNGRIVRLSTAELGLAFCAESSQGACAHAAAFQASLCAPLRLGKNKIDVSLTIGLAINGVGQDLVASTVERANIALDQARSLKLRIGMFDAGIYGNPANNLSLMSEMLLAIEGGELALAYQPKFDLRSRTVTGVEALARWPNHRSGPLGPDVFVPMAEETGHIQALTEWALIRAIADQAALRRIGFDISMSVNLSGRLLHDQAFSEKILAIIGGADRLCLEVTETAAMEDPELAMSSLNRYRAAGINVAIDDYGSGLSSLAYLKNFPATELKIDKAFVLDLENSKRDSLLVRSTINLGHSLGMLVTAEGVETATALSLLAQMGCDAAQGYFIGRPMPLNDLIAFLKRDPDKIIQSTPVKSLASQHPHLWSSAETSTALLDQQGAKCG
jgi:EAL domain-containing protein (putative c-di-GMP-specific phosphodiesterase class I)/GGDEF domain-containing protein